MSTLMNPCKGRGPVLEREFYSGDLWKFLEMRAARYAALLAFAVAANVSASSHFTETSLETPGSCIVTP
jgi:hypothetical protein